MSKDLLVLADEYAAATATFARALALKGEADSMSPIAREAGDKRAVLAEALAALDTAQPALSGCACRWDAEDNRIATCTRHQGWLDVVQEWADRAKDAEAKLAQPPAPGDTAITYMTGYSDGREWAGATSQAQPNQAVELSDGEVMRCISESACYGTVRMSFESGPYSIDKPSLNATKFARAILAAAPQPKEPK